MPPVQRVVELIHKITTPSNLSGRTMAIDRSKKPPSTQQSQPEQTRDTPHPPISHHTSISDVPLSSIMPPSNNDDLDIVANIALSSSTISRMVRQSSGQDTSVWGSLSTLKLFIERNSIHPPLTRGILERFINQTANILRGVVNSDILETIPNNLKQQLEGLEIKLANNNLHPHGGRWSYYESRLDSILVEIDRLLELREHARNQIQPSSERIISRSEFLRTIGSHFYILLGFNPETGFGVIMQFSFEGPDQNNDLPIPPEVLSIVERAHDIGHGLSSLAFDEVQGPPIEEDEYLRAINEFATLIGRDEVNLITIPLAEDEHWRLDRAIMKAAAYSTVPPYAYKAFSGNVYGHLFRGPDKDGWQELAYISDGTFSNMDQNYERILDLNRRSFNVGESFSQWTYAMRTTTTDPYWAYERFIRHVNSSYAQSTERFCYRKFSPCDLNRGYTIKNFPGPGIIVRGLQSKVFPDGHIKNRFPAGGNLSITSRNFTDSEYKLFLNQGEEHLQNTTFVFCRGFTIIDNPDVIKVNGKPYALLIYNDHFQNKTQRCAYLIPHSRVRQFLENPLHGIDNDHMFYPDNIEKVFKDEVIRINLAEVLAGLNEGAPQSLIDILTKEIQREQSISDEVAELKACKPLHHDIRTATLWGFALLDLQKEANRLYNLGFYFNKSDNEWYLDKYRLLRELIRWNKTVNEKEEDPKDKYPVLFPFPLLQHVIEPSLIQKVGMVSSNLVLYKEKGEGDFCFFDGEVPEIGPEASEDRAFSDRIWGDRLGVKGVHRWNEYHTIANESGANVLVMDPIFKGLGLDLIRQGKNQIKEGE